MHQTGSAASAGRRQPGGCGIRRAGCRWAPYPSGCGCEPERPAPAGAHFRFRVVLGTAAPGRAGACACPCRADVVWERGSRGELSVSVVRAQARRRWLVVACVVAVLCALPGVVGALPVPGSALTAAQLRARILASSAVPYQGYAESVGALDLPELPDLGDV